MPTASEHFLDKEILNSGLSGFVQPCSLFLHTEAPANQPEEDLLSFIEPFIFQDNMDFVTSNINRVTYKEFVSEVLDQFDQCYAEAFQDGDPLPTLAIQVTIANIAEEVHNWVIRQNVIDLKPQIYLRYDGGIEFIVYRPKHKGRVTMLLSKQGVFEKVLSSYIEENHVLRKLCPVLEVIRERLTVAINIS